MSSSKEVTLWHLLLLLAAVCIGAGISSKVGRGEKVERDFRYRAELDTKGKLRLYWDIDPPTETVTFRLEANVGKSDLVGFGFSDYGESTNADLVMMWTDENGKHYFQVSSKPPVLTTCASVIYFSIQ